MTGGGAVFGGAGTRGGAGDEGSLGGGGEAGECDATCDRHERLGTQAVARVCMGGELTVTHVGACGEDRVRGQACRG